MKRDILLALGVCTLALVAGVRAGRQLATVMAAPSRSTGEEGNCGGHCGCAASEEGCSMPCSSCCVPMPCKQVPPPPTKRLR